MDAGLKKIAFAIFLILIIVNTAQAGFTCGEVMDSDEGVAASWFSVRVYDSNREIFAQCQVSPGGNKYCCDPESIRDSAWRIGKIYNAEIYNNISGYVSGPVSLISSGEGFDVFPIMQIAKVIKINSPKERLMISNQTNVLLNLSFFPPYTLIKLERDGNVSTLCDNCTSYLNDYLFNYGMNTLRISAMNGNRAFSEDINLAIIASYNFTRNFECEECSKAKAKSEENVSITLDLNLSDEIAGFLFREYVPSGWEILDAGGGKVSYYDEDYNEISWNISGKEILLNYSLKAPKASLFPVTYEFFSQMENLSLGQSKMTGNYILPVFETGQEFKSRTIIQKSYSRISPDNALVFRPKESPIETVAIFPKRTLYNARAALSEYYPKKKILGGIGYYLIDTNVNDSDVGSIYLELSYTKTEIQGGNLSFYYFFSDKWVEIPSNIVKDDLSEVTYGLTISNPADRLAVVLHKDGLIYYLRTLIDFIFGSPEAQRMNLTAKVV